MQMVRVQHKKKAYISLAPDFIPPTPEFMRHFEVEVVGEGRKAKHRVINHPLERYHRRGELNDDQYEAGCTFLKDWAISHEYRGGFSFFMEVRGTIQNDPEYEKTAFERHMRAMKDLNKVSQKIAYSVCIDGKSLKEIHPTMGWRKENSGMDRLHETLDELDDFYYREWQQAVKEKQQVR